MCEPKNTLSVPQLTMEVRLCIGEGPQYKPFSDLRSVPEAGRPREQVKNHGRACTQFLFLPKAELHSGFMVHT
jgi:hypothetical protein